MACRVAQGAEKSAPPRKRRPWIIGVRLPAMAGPGPGRDPDPESRSLIPDRQLMGGLPADAEIEELGSFS
jgi:hypothetical protein